ncbi:MAG: OsmC family protein [Phycisphaeraceae bacterium]|nr:OsmC family protein [Phycisphaeraceae bacterium]
MAVEIDGIYEGQLHCRAIHGPSGSAIVTDAPTDNGGKGASFSPTDLVATALGTCILTTMGILAQRHGWDIEGTRVHVIKEMVTQPLRRIGALRTVVTFRADKAAKLGAEQRQRLEAAGLHCPVHQSLHPDVQAPITFSYEG